VWSKSQPVYFQDFVRSAESRQEYWRQKSATHWEFVRAAPNAGHLALAAWEQTGRLRGLITQNIDGLHARAGNTHVLELHGTALEVACLQCRQRSLAEPFVQQFEEFQQPPACPECGGVLKHATISFGQSLDPAVLRQADQWARDSDLFLAIGSSLVVEPAASLPAIAKQSGARLVIINADPTPLDSRADLVVNARIGETLSGIRVALDSGT
jgi:NAD-dependent deacetylase